MDNAQYRNVLKELREAGKECDGLREYIEGLERRIIKAREEYARLLASYRRVREEFGTYVEKQAEEKANFRQTLDLFEKRSNELQCHVVELTEMLGKSQAEVKP